MHPAATFEPIACEHVDTALLVTFAGAEQAAGAAAGLGVAPERLFLDEDADDDLGWAGSAPPAWLS